MDHTVSSSGRLEKESPATPQTYQNLRDKFKKFAFSVAAEVGGSKVKNEAMGLPRKKSFQRPCSGCPAGS